MTELDKKMGILYVPRSMGTQDVEVLRVIILSAFDRIADEDEKEISAIIEHKKQLKKYYKVKLLLFPFEWFFIRIFMGKEEAKKRIEVYKNMKLKIDKL